MPTYKYEGAYPGGETVTGVVEAVSEHEAVAQIRQSCEVVLSLKEIPRVPGEQLGRFQRIDAKSLALTCQQFAIILKAGLPLVQTVDLAAGQAGDKALARLLRQVSEDVSNGWSLSYSFDQRGGRLPVTFRETIRAGEESGDLISAFERMGAYYERTARTRAKAVSALTYPAFVIAVAVVVVAVIMGYAVPSFIRTFDSLDIELPWVTVALIAVSNFFSRYFLVLLAAAAGAILAVWAYGRTESGGLRLSRLRLALPVVGRIGRMANASQFARTMSAMLAAGMPILQAIEVSGKAMSSLCMSQEVLSAVAGVESGRSLGDCLASSRELPPMLVEMTAVASRQGRWSPRWRCWPSIMTTRWTQVPPGRCPCWSRPSSSRWPSLLCLSFWPCTCLCSVCTALSEKFGKGHAPFPCPWGTRTPVQLLQTADQRLW